MEKVFDVCETSLVEAIYLTANFIWELSKSWAGRTILLGSLLFGCVLPAGVAISVNRIAVDKSAEIITHYFKLEQTPIPTRSSICGLGAPLIHNPCTLTPLYTSPFPINP